jgi:hypothetical protein
MANDDVKFPHQLYWLEDAALLFDDMQIDRLYDALASPEHRQKSLALSISKETVKELTGKATGEIGAEVPAIAAILAPIFAFVKPSIKLTGEGEGRLESTNGEVATIELETITSPQRQLKQLALFYFVNHRSQTFFVDDARQPKWRETAAIAERPRPLVFLSLPGAYEAEISGAPKTKLVPTAAEFESGKVIQIYTDLQFSDEPIPDYPDKGDAATLLEERKKYWVWFDRNFSATKAMLAIERAAAGNGRIRWIDYRLPVSENGDTLHLHVVANEKYDTGTLAYNFVKRGYKHGLRVIGTLKSEPDMNVLAIFER